MTRKRKPIKAPTGPKEQNRKQSFSIEKPPIDGNPKLKKLVADFKKAHKAFCDNLLQATYRLIHDARQIGDLLLKIKQEGGFKSKRQLHIWLEFQAEVSIPQPTFYRYIQAAENFQKVEVIHGTKMLTEISSNKVLKMLANPKVQLEPQDYGWEHNDGVFTKGDWTIRNHNGTKHLWEAHNSKGEKGFVMGSLKDIIEAVQDRIDTLTPPSGKPVAEVAQKDHVSHASTLETQDAETDFGDDSDTNGEHDEEQKSGEAAQESQDAQAKGQTHFHHGCKDFKIDDDRTLSFTNQHGDRVRVVSEKSGIERLLVKAISSITCKGGAQ
jgi:hypothetical protein